MGPYGGDMVNVVLPCFVGPKLALTRSLSPALRGDVLSTRRQLMLGDFEMLPAKDGDEVAETVAGAIIASIIGLFSPIFGGITLVSVF